MVHRSLWEENHLGRNKILCGGRKSSMGRMFSIGMKSSGAVLVVLEVLVEMGRI